MPIKIVLTDGLQRFAEGEADTPDQINELNTHTKEATGGNLLWLPLEIVNKIMPLDPSVPPGALCAKCARRPAVAAIRAANGSKDAVCVDCLNGRPRPLVNRRMAEKIAAGEVIDVNEIGQEISPGVWELRPGEFMDGVDYCDAAGERWIWSVGLENASGKVFASLDGRYYQNPDFKCLWLR